MKDTLKGKKISKLIGLSASKDKKSTKRFKVDEKLTNDKHTVVTDKKRGGKIVVFRGTNVADTRDLRSDAALAVGQEKNDPRFKNSKSFLKKVRKSSKDEGMGSKLTVVGHSLGGSLAQFASKKRDKVITVNKGAGINEIGKKIHKNQTDIRNRNDVISGLSLLNRGAEKEDGGTISLHQLGSNGAHSYKTIPKENKF